MTQLKDKVIIITGASGGMGRVVSEALAETGARLALFSNDSEALCALSEKISQKTTCISRTVDVCDEEQVRTAVEETAQQLGAPYALLNLAGLSIPAEISEMKLADFETVMDVNVQGTFLFSKHFANAVDAQAGGQIINIGSMAAKRANGNAPVYCTAKAAVNMLSAGMAIQYKKLNIRVTTLNPGGTDTPFWGNRPVDRQKLMQPDDIAGAILFVLTQDRRVAISELNFESFLMG